MAKQLESRPGINTGANQYGGLYSNLDIDHAKLYANFRFNEKYNRHIHPAMFLL